MAWLDVTLAVLIVWVAIDVAVVAALMAASQRDVRTRRPASRPAEYGGLRLVSSRPGSARLP